MLNGPFDPSQIEHNWNKAWQEHAQQQLQETQQDPFCIVIPPPNVTGTLHMGHGFQMTLMDTLIRFHRMNGHPTHWQMGTDHAGIATQMVVERNLTKQGTTKESLGRDAFEQTMWQWVEHSGDHIRSQIKRMGFLVDWESERFTLDEDLSHTVRHVFHKMYDDGLIYRGEKMVNWDTQLETAVSDLEVISETKQVQLYTLNYQLASSPDTFISVATTRPETLFGDQAIAVHPEDDRFKRLIGTEVLVPLTGRTIPIIADDYVDPEFGTGCVKITPAHDFNDFEMGKRHHLTPLNIMNPNGTLNTKVPKDFQGLDRFEARKRLIATLEASGQVTSIESYKTQLPFGDRSNTLLEPRITHQWFVRMKDLAINALEAVRRKEVEFHPPFWESTYQHWLDNIEDWCISRQLWWGHRIPCWYDNEGNAYVGQNEEDVRRAHHLSADHALRQDDDVLDTWFSSALWPFSTLGWPDVKHPTFQQFFPSHVLITGHDLIFFWVARMIMMSLYLTDSVPFKHVYFTGLIKDPQGKKMSKSKGNVVDPIDLISGTSLDALIEKRTANLMQPQMAKAITKATEKAFPKGIQAHGTDALRFTFLALSGGHLDIKFDFNRLTGYKHFANKIWNASRLILMNATDKSQPAAQPKTPLDHWLQHELNLTIQATQNHLADFRFDLAAQVLHQYVWGTFCDWYLELIKPKLHDQCQDTLSFALHQLTEMLTLMHPFMPYVTEEIHHQMTKHSMDQTLLIHQPYPKPLPVDGQLHGLIQSLQQCISSVRTLRADILLPQATKLTLFVLCESNLKDTIEQYKTAFSQLTKADQIHYLAPNTSYDEPHLRVDTASATLLIPLKGLTGLDLAISGSQKKIKNLENSISKTESKLSSPKFREKAPELANEAEDNLNILKTQHQRLSDHLKQLMAHSD